MDLLYYRVKTKDKYQPKRFNRYCRCDPQCDTAVDFLDPLSQDVLFTICHNRAIDYGYGLMKLTGMMKYIPVSKADHSMWLDGRTLNRSWTKDQEKELIDIIKVGVKSGDYRIFAMKHGKTRVAVKEKVRYMRKVGMIE